MILLLAVAASWSLPLPSQALETVTLQLKWLHQFQFVGYYAAKAKGYYKDVGLDVNMIEAKPGKKAIDPVLDGTAQYGVDGPNLLLTRGERKPVVALCAIFQHSPAVVLARQDTPIQSIHSLTGRRIMLDEGNDEILAYFRKEHLSPEKYSLLKHSFNPQDLIDGKTDAITAYTTNELFYFDKAGFRYMAFSPRSAGIDFYGDILYTTEQEIVAHPSRVKAFREASIQGWKYALAHPEEMADLILAQYSQRKSREYLLFEAKQMMELIRPDLIEIGYMNPGRWRNIADTYAELGMLPRNVSLDGFMYDPDPKHDNTKLVFVVLILSVCLAITAGFVVILKRMVGHKTAHLETEIAERKEAEDILKKSEKRHRTIIETTMDGFWLVDGQGRLLEVNETYARMSGYTVQELLTMGIADLEVNESASDAVAHNKKIKEQGEDRFVSKHRCKDGKIFDVEVSAKYLPVEGGLFVGFLRDITERKKAEEQLRITRFSIDHSSDGLFWMTSDASIVDVNEAACRSLGYSREELLQLRVPDIDPLYNDDVLHNFYVELQQKSTLTFETEHQTKDGKRFPVEIVANLIQFDSKELTCAFVRNITERKNAENSLAEAKAFTENALNTIIDIFYSYDLNGRFLYWNKTFSRISGYSDHELSSMSPADFFQGDDIQHIADAVEKIFQVGSATEEAYFVTKDGRKIPCEFSGSVLRDSSDNIIGFSGIGRDITDRKKAEEEKQILEQQLLHTQKLESLGVLSGGIAHDFNNILAIIMGYCSLTKLNYETAEKNIPIIENAAERAAGLCRQMMAYAGKAQLTKTKINIVEKVDEIVDMLKATLPQNVMIKTDLPAEIPIIEGDASQLEQVVMNLIINSSEAIGNEQGEVIVSLTKIKVIAGKTYEDYHGKPIPIGEYVCLEVTDNGCGMDEATRWRIFEPFYTTKFTGRGLGMSAVLGIIKSHAGALQLFSQLGHGTTFKVYLPTPMSGTSEHGEQTASAPVAPWQGSGTILLVEDEEPIRDIAKNFLEMFGFSVLEAVNGREALDIYQKNAAEITLVVTDMGMPVMDGYELFSELKKLNPELPIIVTSGYGDAEVSARIGSDNIAGTISKPYNPSQLREILKSVVGDMSTRI